MDPTAPSNNAIECASFCDVLRENWQHYRTLVARNCLQGLYPVLHTAVSEFATFLPPTGVDMLHGGQRVRDAHSLLAECADHT